MQHVSDSKREDDERGARYLIKSIRKHGVDSHKVKTIFICPTTQANYYEVKFIRQYNTQVPSGLNIMKGGKNAPLAEETKKKLSEAKKGRYTGEQNPMFGKHHSEETREKIRQTQIGKVLPQSQKENMSKAHTQHERRKVATEKNLY